MGIIEGAIIGGAMGLITSLIMILARKGARTRLLRALREQGREAARALLDKKAPVTTKVGLNQISDQRERMAGLALLADPAAIEQELAGHTGTLTAVTQVNAMGLLGLAVRAADPAPAARRLDELATHIEAEGGRALALVKKKTRALAVLAAGLTGREIPPATRLTLESFQGDGGVVQLLVWQATAQALEAVGQTTQARGLRQKVQRLTDGFAS